MKFVSYRLKHAAPKGHYAEFHAVFEEGGREQSFDKHTVEQIAQNSSKRREQAEFALEHWPAMS